MLLRDEFKNYIRQVQYFLVHQLAIATPAAKLATMTFHTAHQSEAALPQLNLHGAWKSSTHTVIIIKVLGSEKRERSHDPISQNVVMGV